MRKTALLAVGIALLVAGCREPAAPDGFAIFMDSCTEDPAPFTAKSTEAMCGCGWHALGGATDSRSVNVVSAICSSLLVRQ